MDATANYTFERCYWISHSMVAVIALLLNLVMSLTLVRGTLLKKSFYSLMLIFNTMTVAFQTIIILDVIVSHTSSDERLKVSLVRILASYFEIVSWYFTSTLVFLIGLNRLAVLTTGPISSFFADRKRVLWCSFILLGFSTFAGIISSGIISILSELFGVDFANDFFLAVVKASSPVEWFFAALPLCSCLFYIAAFKKLRSVRRRSSMTFGATDKAEKSILKQGFLLCVFYMILEMTLLIKQYAFYLCADFFMLCQIVYYISMNLPPIGFPVIVFLCSKEFRKLFLVNCFKLHCHTQPFNIPPPRRVFTERNFE
ncbi:hypothetical protein V3C99_007934 [Haemonchus contortus]